MEPPPPPPPGLHPVTQDMKQKQRQAPEHWAISVRDFLRVMEHIFATPTYKELSKHGRVVTFHDINKHFVQPWTAGSGCGLAVMVTGGAPCTPASVMTSHSWSEDAKECVDAIKRELLAGSITDTDLMWFCVFANYQCEDGAGPTIKDQLAMNPFECVIKSPGVRNGRGMMVIETTADDVYRRLWCVFELFTAIQMNVHIFAASSELYLANLHRRTALFAKHGFSEAVIVRAAGITTAACAARCSSEADEEMIVQLIKSQGGFDLVDAKVQAFRTSSLAPDARMVIQFSKLNSMEPAAIADGVAAIEQIASSAEADSKDVGGAIAELMTETAVASLSAFLNEQRGRRAFHQLDRNGNGTISRDEWRQFFDGARGDASVISRKRWLLRAGDTQLFNSIVESGKVDLTGAAWERAFDSLPKDAAGELAIAGWRIQRARGPAGPAARQSGAYPSHKGGRDRLWRECCIALAQGACRWSTEARLTKHHSLQPVVAQALGVLERLARQQNNMPQEQKRRALCEGTTASAVAAAATPAFSALPAKCLATLLAHDFQKDAAYISLLDQVLRSELDGELRRSVTEARFAAYACKWDPNVTGMNAFLWEIDLKRWEGSLVNADPWFLKIPDFLTEEEMVTIAESMAPLATTRSLPNRQDSQCAVGPRTVHPEFAVTFGNVMRKIAGAMSMPASHLEALQYIAYAPGGYFGMHLDGFGDRCVTMFIYLDTVPENEGGSTWFPQLNLRMFPVRGTAIVFPNGAKSSALEEDLRAACQERGGCLDSWSTRVAQCTWRSGFWPASAVGFQTT